MSYSSGDFRVFEKENLDSSFAIPSAEVMVVCEDSTPVAEPSYHPSASSGAPIIEGASLVRRRKKHSPVKEEGEGGGENLVMEVIEETLREEEATFVVAKPSTKKERGPMREPKERRVAHAKDTTVGWEVSTIGSFLRAADLEALHGIFSILDEVVLR